MPKVIRIDYDITSRATHLVLVPDWFNPNDKKHMAVFEDTDLGCEDYDSEHVVEVHTATAYEYKCPKNLALDYTDIEEP